MRAASDWKVNGGSSPSKISGRPYDKPEISGLPLRQQPHFPPETSTGHRNAETNRLRPPHIPAISAAVGSISSDSTDVPRAVWRDSALRFCEDEGLITS